MASDKGQLKSKETTWAKIAPEKLTMQKLQVAISVNKSQVDAYSSIFRAEQAELNGL